MSAFDETLCWSCQICTFNNALEAGACGMCNNPRPEEQYLALIEIREQARRQRMIKEEEERQIALLSNKESIQQQSVYNAEEDKKHDQKETDMLLDDDENWDDEDFKDDDCWESDGNDEAKCSQDDENGWSDVEVEDTTSPITKVAKIPQKKQLYEVLNPSKLYQESIKFMQSLSEHLCIDNLDDIGIICRHYRWNRAELMDDYLQNSQNVLTKCGIISSAKCIQSKATSNEFFDCWLCVQKVHSIDTFCPQQCGHRYCNECWSNYLISQMEKGPRCVQTKCIDPKCKLTLRPSVFIKFLPHKHRIKFEEYLLHSFVSGLNTLRWCPGKECTNAIKAEYASAISIDCPSCHSFWCFACSMEAHLPCDCELARKWMDLQTTDSENVTWVRAYTKECPKCHNHIEKNQGCNHMTCRCGYEFCWLCRKDWKKIGYGHQCNKPQNVINEENEQRNAQSYLKRYIFYFDRFAAHQKSAEIALKSIENAKECVRWFIIEKDFKYSDLSFIEDGIREIIECRKILQWSYCFGYYLCDGSQLKILFESQQGLLESFVDNLHEKAEKNVDDKTQWIRLIDIKFRTELINLTKTAKKYRNNLCDALLSDDSLPFVFQKGIK